MPDGVRISQSVPTLQARPDTGWRLVSAYVARPTASPRAQQKTPPGLLRTGSFSFGSSPVEFRDLSGGGPSHCHTEELTEGVRHGHPQSSGRFKHRQRRARH